MLPSQSEQSNCTMTKMLTVYHQQPYRRYLRNQLVMAYDFFLDLQRWVESLVAEQLREDTDDWRLLHSCPCCTHKVRVSRCLITIA
jgi:hypothetical protein